MLLLVNEGACEYYVRYFLYVSSTDGSEFLDYVNAAVLNESLKKILAYFFKSVTF